MFFEYSFRTLGPPSHASIEILVNRQSFSEAPGASNKNLILTRFTAGMVLSAMPTIQQFDISEGSLPRSGHVIEYSPRDGQGHWISGRPPVLVTKFDSFTDRERNLIEKPTLLLRSRGMTTRFGRARARGFVILRDEIEAFIDGANTDREITIAVDRKRPKLGGASCPLMTRR